MKHIKNEKTYYKYQNAIQKNEKHLTFGFIMTLNHSLITLNYMVITNTST